MSGIFVDLEDANNRVKRLVREEYCHDNECEITTHGEGMVRWHCSDTGEGDNATIFVKKHLLRGPGSEKKRDWPKSEGDLGNDEVDGEGEEEEEEEDE